MARPLQTSSKTRKAPTKPSRDATQDAPNNAPSIIAAKSRTKKRTRTALRDDEEEHQSDGDEAPPPKRVRKNNDSTKPKSKLRPRKTVEQSGPVDNDMLLTNEAAESKEGKERFALSLFYGETAPKQQLAKRILCIRSIVGPSHAMVAEESKSRFLETFEVCHP